MTTAIAGVALVPLLVGIIHAAKAAGVPSNVCPILDFALGALFGVALHFTGDRPDWVVAVFIGLGIGGSAAGIWDSVTGIKATITGTSGGTVPPPTQTPPK